MQKTQYLTNTNNFFFSVKPEIKVKNDVIGSSTGLSMVLTCKIEAFPEPIIYWSSPLGITIYL